MDFLLRQVAKQNGDKQSKKVGGFLNGKTIEHTDKLNKKER